MILKLSSPVSQKRFGQNTPVAYFSTLLAAFAKRTRRTKGTSVAAVDRVTYTTHFGAKTEDRVTLYQEHLGLQTYRLWIQLCSLCLKRAMQVIRYPVTKRIPKLYPFYRETPQH